jgi:hypothetical protein
MKKIAIAFVAGFLLVTMTTVVIPKVLAPAEHDAFNEYLTFWSGDLRIFTLTGNASVTIYDLDTNLPLDFSDPRIDSTNFTTNPFVLENAGDAFEGVGGLGEADEEIRVRVVSSDALGGDANRPIFLWTGSLGEDLRHPDAPPTTDNPWMSYLFGLPQADSPFVFSRKLGRDFLGFTSREMYIFAHKEITPTNIVITDMATNTESDDDDSQTLGAADAIYTNDEIEVYYLDQFEDDTVTVTGTVDLSVMVGISSQVADDWTVTPPSYAPGDDGFRKGRLFYTFVRTRLTVFPLEDNTTVTITDLSDGDDSKTITFANGDTTGDYDFYTPSLESDTPTTGDMLARPSAPAVTILTNDGDGFDDDFVKVESDKPILVYVGPVASDWNEFADFSFTIANESGKRIVYVYAQDSGGSNDLQIFSISPTTVVTITSLSRTEGFKAPVWHDFVIGPGIGECPPMDGTTYVPEQPWCKGTADGGVWWGSTIWGGEVLRVESDEPVIVLNGDYDTPHFGAFVPYFAYTGSIEIRKAVAGVDDDSTSFNFTFNGEPFSLKNGESQPFNALQPGAYTIAELVPEGWLLAEISCNNDQVLPNPDPAEVTIDVDFGQDIVCTFTNEYLTAVDLLSFTAKAGADSVTLNWETASEIDNVGFNIWRSQKADGPYTQLNATLIPAKGNADTGASYEYTDADVVQGVTYHYKLEDVDIHAGSAFHGPVSATPARFRRIFLPIIFGGLVLSGATAKQRRNLLS